MVGLNTQDGTWLRTHDMNLGIAGPLRSVLVSMVLVLPVALASCRVTPQSVTQSQYAHDYDRLEIIYQAHPATGPLFSTVSPLRPASPEIVQAAAEVPVAPPLFQNMSWSRAELRIECPHPDGRTDYARVTVRFKPVECGQECRRASWSEQVEQRTGLRQSRQATFRERLFYESATPAQNGETYSELDLPKSELDAILAELNSHGFFAEHGRPSDAESQLEVRLNRRWTSKRWGYEPALDALTTRVCEEGTSRAAIVEGDAVHSTRSGLSNWLMPFGHSR